MGLPENIDALLVKFDLTPAALAESVGVADSTVSRWRNGGKIRGTNLEALCRLYELTEDDILSTYNGLAAKEHGYAGKGFVAVPLHGRVAAGIPIEMLEVDDMTEAPARYVDDDPQAFMVRVVGDSMNRHIHDGEYALVSPKYTEPNDRDMFLVTVNGYDATIKPVRRLANGVELLPDSYDPTYRPQVYDFNEDDTPAIKILGKVVWWCKEF